MLLRLLSTLALGVALLCGGCATFTPAELDQISRRGVSSNVVGKLDRGRMLSPGEVIELTRRGVSEGLILRHLEDTGIDYVLSKGDVTRMRRAGVSALVIDVMVRQSDNFARIYSRDDYSTSVGVHYGSPYGYGYGYDPYYYDSYPGYNGRYYGGHYHDRGHRHRDNDRHVPLISPRRIFR